MKDLSKDLSPQRKLFTNYRWLSDIYLHCSSQDIFYDSFDYHEAIGISYSINPIDDHVASRNINVFDPKKAAAMYFWYKSADKSDKSILEYFEEYKNCIDKTHQWFNSNYGIYAYKYKGLQRCIDILLNKPESRQACFMINNNAAMEPSSIDKLCTNAVMFFIRDGHLYMIVQMRSSNLLTLMPYDVFIFSTWYAKVYNALIKKYRTLKIKKIKIQIASSHYYQADFNNKTENIKLNGFTQLFNYTDVHTVDFEKRLEDKLLTFLNT